MWFVYLTSSLEFLFVLGAQHYDFFFSHSTTASGGVCTVIWCASGMKVTKIFEVKGHLLVVDLENNNDCLRIINVYALNKHHERSLLFKVATITNYFKFDHHYAPIQPIPRVGLNRGLKTESDWK